MLNPYIQMTDERKQAEEILIEKEILYKYEGELRFNEDIILRGFVRIFTEALEAYAALKVAEVTKWIYVRDETPPENTQLLAMSPYGVVHITNWRPAYEIFNCQCKSENSQDWQWKLY